MAVELSQAQLNAYKNLYITDENAKWLSTPELYTITPTVDNTAGYDTYNGVPDNNGQYAVNNKNFGDKAKSFAKGALGVAACAGLCVATGGAALPFIVAGGLVAGGISLLGKIFGKN